jgi:lipoate-protein ligase A
MTLDLLPFRAAGAAENMAADFLLLKRSPPDRARFRHYGWRAPAFTFGYSQKIADVRAQLPPGETVELCRRATGGGLVDHRDDWTYALVVPRGHALEEMRATQSYQLVHAALTAALVAQGVPAKLQPAPETPPTGGFPAGVCFQRAETFDVCRTDTGTKLAGAAQKRSKQGMLFQGSLWKPFVGPLDWDQFGDDFAARLATTLAAEAAPAPWPDEVGDEELSALADHYASAEWNEAR